MEKRLSASTLKIIAIAAMVIDHTAWGFVEMFSPMGQIMHVIGRLTIPIMSFFIAEGYRKTSNLRKYIFRMVIFSLVSVVPFYIFFGEEYGYRQNFIFDLLLALLVLVTIDSKKLSKGLKVIIAGALIIISAVIGGWPVYPICLVLIFYYGKTFKQKAVLMSGMTVFLIAFVTGMIIVNNNYYHFMSYDWRWYQWFYFLGFVLALPLLYMYNGERGNYPIGKYFFFTFYPGHFIVLWTIKYFGINNNHSLYIWSLVLCLVLAVMTGYKLTTLRPSRALIMAEILCISGFLYIFGFIMEVLTGTLEMAYAGTIVQYLGECGVFLSFLWFMGEFCQKRIPKWILSLSMICTIIIMFLILTVEKNHIFYRNMAIDNTGVFPRLTLEYGPGFYFFVIYSFVFCVGMIVVCASVAINEAGLAKKRAIYLIVAILCPWIAFLIKFTPLTDNYEVSSLGVFGSLITIYYAIIRHGFFDSVQLAGENALHTVGDGIIVMNQNYIIKYRNASMEKLLPSAKVDEYAMNIPILREFIHGNESRLVSKDRIYSISVTELHEGDSVQGYMLKASDMTDYLRQLEAAEKYANTDPLTGLSNRGHYSRKYEEFRKHGGTGTFIMLDLDGFKGVNDTLGHDGGDTILVLAAKAIKKTVGKESLACRFGGDEFSVFLKSITTEDEVGKICQSIIDTFDNLLLESKLPVETSVTVGAVIVNRICYGVTREDFREYYKLADAALYKAKEAGKHTYRISNE